ncbi:MAG: hypothetical protein QJR01_04125 [Kyrpidia sp.]|nr:hypothetical protein [Kyrpidia sp.]
MKLWIPDRDIWEIGAFWPVYNHLGDSTLLLWRNGQSTLLPTSATRVLKDLAASLAVDLTQLRGIYGREVSRKLAVPLALHDRLLLVPLRVRRAVISGDEVYGYFDFSCIQGVRVAANGQTEIAVAERIVPLEQRLRSVREQLNRAKTIAWMYQLRTVERVWPIRLWTSDEKGWPASLGEDRRVYPWGDSFEEDPFASADGSRTAPSASSSQVDPSTWKAT